MFFNVFFAVIPFMNPVDAVVTDIEGTTSSITFVKESLFPYARKHMAHFLETHQNDPRVKAIIADICRMEDIVREDVLATLNRWMDEDKKITHLKELQGLIWEAGYRSGLLQGHFYDDAIDMLQQWDERGIPLYFYSSGSVVAQKLLAEYSDHGDVTPLFEGYFDTKIGGKRESASYSAIAEQIQVAPERILFLSDTVAELDAADIAGFQTIQLCRDVCEEPSQHQQASTFFEIEIP